MKLSQCFLPTRFIAGFVIGEKRCYASAFREWQFRPEGFYLLSKEGLHVYIQEEKE